MGSHLHQEPASGQKEQVRAAPRLGEEALLKAVAVRGLVAGEERVEVGEQPR